MRTKCLITILCLISLTSRVYAGWSGPQEVISGSWGSGIGQFYFASGDSFDSFPKNIGVDKHGVILVADEDNNRILIYNNDGTVKKVLAPPAGLPTEDSMYGWPSSTGFVLYSGGNSFALDCEYKIISGGIQPLKICFLDYNGNILNKADMSEVFPIETGFVLLRNNIYSLYSPTGQLIKTSTTRPLELGEVTEDDIGKKRYKTTVKYDDAVYTIISERTYENYARDKNKALYAINPGRVDKYSLCGKLTGSLVMPKKMTFKGDEVPGQEQYILTHDEYGAPVIDINGNVYTWKRSPSKYSILKWTWVADPSDPPSGPDAPTGLKLMPSTTGLYLTWEAAPQDPGCVTGYDIVRASSSGGIYSTVATVDKGVIKYNDTNAASGTTYYYKIRAVAGTEFSPYTSEVSGKR